MPHKKKPEPGQMGLPGVVPDVPPKPQPQMRPPDWGPPPPKFGKRRKFNLSASGLPTGEPPDTFIENRAQDEQYTSGVSRIKADGKR